MFTGFDKNLFINDISLYYGSIKIIGKHKPKPQIGKFVSIASGVSWVAVGHKTTRVTTFPFSMLGEEEINHPQYYEDLHIGNDVYIGNDVMFVGNCYIGDGAIIGARSVVRGHVMPYSIVTGNPAAHVRYRFIEIDIDLLLKVKWWNWPLEEIIEQKEILCGNDPILIYSYALKKGYINE